MPPLMTHAYIDEHDLVSRYAMNKMSAEEQAAFEAHLIDCVECLDHLDQTTALRDGLRKVAAADAVPLDAARADAAPANAALGPRRPVRPAARGGWSLPLELAAAAVLIAAVAGVATIVPMRRQLTRATTAAADWQRRYDEAGRSAGALQDRLAAAERELAQRPAAPSIEASVPVFGLSIVRSSEGSPPAQISIPASAPFVVLSVELPGASGFPLYRAVLTNAAGQTVWSAEQLRPTSPEALGIALSARLIPPGDYVLTLEGVGRQGRTVPLSHYRIRVTSSQ
jgi:putative zinc finger protein